MTEETIKEILKFRDDREWKQFHNPKDLAISISVEAAELLEVFQWSGCLKWRKTGEDKRRTGGCCELLCLDGRCLRIGSGWDRAGED